jgi:wyosine [tRNA(Phe)-imidazoG37] synthetase (radical SAM superfamily)
MNSQSPAPQGASPAKYVFGPVPSRRLGRSLGIDLVPRKTCTYNCIYCQLGRTTDQTLKRKAYVPGRQVLEEVERMLSVLSPPPDYITFSGSGEPTLNSQIGWVIEQVNRITPVPVAVLTNGSLLHLESVRDALAGADLVIPSLDAATPALFGAMNRPHPSLHLSQILRGLQEFRREFAGQVWLEIMVCGGFNDDPKEIKRLREEIEKISPDRIQLNTVVRPPAEDFAYPLNSERMEQVRELFGGSAEILSGECPAPASRMPGRIDREVFALLERRPCSLEDLSQAFGVSEETIERYLRRLNARGVLGYQVHNRTVFYKAKPNRQSSLCPAR